MKIAFIGLGAMGYPMAGHLAKHHEVTVWNRTPDVAVRHAEQFKTRIASSLEEVASAEVIVTILPTSREVDSIVDRLFSHLKEGTLWIDATSGDPGTSRETAKRLAMRGVEFVDSPVTGGTPAAEKGTLTVMIGGSSEAFERAEPLVKAFGSKIVHVGEVGNGHAIKAMNNAMMGANMLMASECLLTLKKMGVSVAVALDVINGGSGRSNATENLLPSRVLDGSWPLTFKLSLLDKDIRIAAAMAHEQHAGAPLLALTSQLYTAALRELGPDADYVEVAKFAAMLAGENW